MPSVLIVDDEYATRLELTEMLAAAGYEVAGEAETGHQAVEIVSKLQPDLILMDVVLPGGMDGISAARRIKETSDIPLVFMSGYGDPEHIERAKRVEPFGYLMKPFDETEVKAFVEIALYKSKLERDLKSAQEELRRTNQALKQEAEERKAFEEALKVEQDKFRFLTENLVDIVWIIDFNFQTTYVSLSIETVLGFPPEERKTQSLEEMITPESAERTKALLISEFQREMAGESDPERSIKIDIEYYRKDGSTLWMENCVKFIRNREGAVTGMLGVSRDISKRRLREQEIKRLHNEWQGIFKAIGNPTLLIDPDHRILHCNTATQKALGKPLKEIVGKKCHELFHSTDSAPENCPFQKMLETGQTETVEMEVEALGSTFLVSCAPMLDQDGCIEKVVHIATDISERKRTEEISKRLQHSRKMEAIATLTGGIAHDYNNLLGVIMGNLSLAREDIEPGSEISGFLNGILEASLKARDLTYELMTLSRGGFPVKKPGSIKALLRTVAETVFRGNGIRWSLDVNKDLWPLEYDSEQIQFTFANVLENAAEAMPEGGTVTCRIENLIIGRDETDTHPDLPKGRYVGIVIADEGKGIPEDDLDKIFDPYFSTKERGVQKGMGMGLTTAYAIVKKHGGAIEVNSAEDSGTTVRIYLPAIFTASLTPLAPAD